MTEQQLHAVKEFGNLPIYDEDDESGCDSLNAVRVGEARYEGASPEAEDDVQFWNLLRDTRYELKVAIRYSPTDVRQSSGSSGTPAPTPTTDKIELPL